MTREAVLAHVETRDVDYEKQLTDNDPDPKTLDPAQSRTISSLSSPNDTVLSRCGASRFEGGILR